MNAVRSAAGAWTPTMTTIEPITAASEYAGAVEASPIASAPRKPIASALRVSCCSAGAAAGIDAPSTWPPPGPCPAESDRALTIESSGAATR